MTDPIETLGDALPKEMARESQFIFGPCDGARLILSHADPFIVQRLPSSTAVYARRENGDYVFACYQPVGWGKKQEGSK